MENKVLILDFGSQYTQLIARRVRELNIYCEIHPFNHLPDDLDSYAAVILSGSPYSVRQADAPQIDLSGIRGRVPLLGVCYGAQYMAQKFGGEVAPGNTREYGRANIVSLDVADPLTRDIPVGTQVWMSHGDTIEKLPEQFRIVASTADVPVAAYHVAGENTYGIQFHPEVYHSEHGTQLLKNFLVDIAGLKQDWTPDSFVESTVASIKETVGDDRVILGHTGGVDSTVAGVLLSRAIGDHLTCIFVNNGLLRKNEFDDVLAQYKDMGLNIIGVDASERFYKALAGVSDPEKKRKAIGAAFIEVFDQEASKIKDAKWLAQGTIYPDVIESCSVKGPSATIKSHHNVGGLPDYMKLKVVEPLRTLFKDEVRRVGAALGIPDVLLSRHPFPGPGLAIRILGDVTPEKVAVLQEVDDIFISALRQWDLYKKVWQAGAVLLPIQSVGVMGDERTYERVVALRAVGSTDGMTADWSHLPYEFLAKVSNDIINKVKGVNRVVYDISSKPPATIEWE